MRRPRVDIDDRDCPRCEDGTCTDHCVRCSHTLPALPVLGDDAWWAGPGGRSYCSVQCLELEAERRADIEHAS